MARAVEGHRRFLGHRKTITLDRKGLFQVFDKLENGELEERSSLSDLVMKMHKNRSPSAKYLALSSQDGYCTPVEFENDELGSPISSSAGKFTADERKSPIQKLEDMVIEATPNNNFVDVDGIKTEAERSEGKRGSPSSMSTPILNKPAKKRITPTAISPP